MTKQRAKGLLVRRHQDYSRTPHAHRGSEGVKTRCTLRPTGVWRGRKNCGAPLSGQVWEHFWVWWEFHLLHFARNQKCQTKREILRRWPGIHACDHNRRDRFRGNMFQMCLSILPLNIQYTVIWDTHSTTNYRKQRKCMNGFANIQFEI